MEHKFWDRYGWILSGILGVVCLGIGDWLLGYVRPGLADGVTENLLTVGYTEGYALWKPQAAMFLCVFGLLFYFPAMWKMADIIKPEKLQRWTKYLYIFSLSGWQMIHIFYSLIAFWYAWLSQNADAQSAVSGMLAFFDAFAPAVYPWYLLVALSYVVHFAAVVSGKTRCPRRMALAHPMVWYLLFVVVSNLLPRSSFANGLYFFSMNGSMLAWLVAMLIFTMMKGREGRG